MASSKLGPDQRVKPHPLPGIQEERASDVNTPGQADDVCQHSNTDAAAEMQGCTREQQRTNKSSDVHVFSHMLLFITL